MKSVAMTVNGRPVQAMVEPRTHLADFLREHCRLTGTHLGCEHGVCGACTVLIDGELARSCLAYAIACEGFQIQTIEGFDDDAIMQDLRTAFSREHGLQCGFCTPGMLLAARDVVQRVPDADEHRIRVELSGNLCRCTGYSGIVKAVKSVAELRRSRPSPAPAAASEPAAVAAPFAPFVASSRSPPPQQSTAQPVAAPDQSADRKGWTRFDESFLILKPAAAVWQVFADVPTVAACLPGAELTECDARNAKGKMTMKVGPIVAAFAGSALIERDEAAMRGVIRGAGSDQGTGSRTKGEVSYRLVSEGDKTRVFITVEYSLQGMLAQFSRSGLVQELGRRLVADFATNLNVRLAAPAATNASAAPAAPLNAGRLIWLWLREQLRRRLQM